MCVIILLKKLSFFQYLFRALKDAEKAIKLSKDWPKGYFRKGRALAGLNVSHSVCPLFVYCHSVCASLFFHFPSVSLSVSPSHPLPSPLGVQEVFCYTWSYNQTAMSYSSSVGPKPEEDMTRVFLWNWTQAVFCYTWFHNQTVVGPVLVQSQRKT